MGSPLSPALCLMVVSISEQIWSINFNQLLSNHSLFIRHIRYVDNRLIFGDKRLLDLAPYEVLLDDGFYGKPIILETEPDQEFLGFMLETQPLELIYQGPTNISQVLSPFSASPPKVLLSGFRSRCHIVIKGAFPHLRVLQGLDQLIRLYTTAGFPKEDLQIISDQLLLQHSACGVKILGYQLLVVVVFCAFFFLLRGVFSFFFFIRFHGFHWFFAVLTCHCCCLFSQRVQAIAIPLCTVSLLWPWIMHKEELSIIILPGLSCTSTFWLDYSPSSSPLLKLKKVHLIHLLMNLNPIAVFTPLFHCQLTANLPHWPPTEESHRGLS